MTSPLSLLSLLGPTPADAAPAAGDADPGAHDPAAFAAALLAALTAVRPPAAPVPVVVAEPVEVDVPDEGEGSAEEHQGSLASLGMTEAATALGMTDAAGALEMTDPAGALGMAASVDAPVKPESGDTTGTTISVDVPGMSLSVGATAVELPETSHVDPGALTPVTGGVVEAPLVPATNRQAAPEGAAPAVKTCDKADATTPASSGKAESLRPRGLPEEIVRAMTPFTGTLPVERHAPKGPRIAPVTTPAMPVELPAAEVGPAKAPEASSRQPDDIIAIVAQAVETALPPERSTGATRARRDKAPSRDSATRGDRPGAQRDATVPPATPTPALLSVLQAVVELARPILATKPDAGSGSDAAGQESNPQAVADAAPQPNATPTEGLEAWSMAGNARLATQIADLMDGLNVTEFRVELGKRVAGAVKAATTGGGTTTAAADNTAPATPVLHPAPTAKGEQAAPALPPLLQRASQPMGETRPPTTSTPDKPLMPASQLLGATILNRPAEKDLAVPTADVALTSSQAIDDDLAEPATPSPNIRQATTPVINAERGTRNAERPGDQLPLPRTSSRQSPAATLPAPRQDLPVAETAARPAPATEAERPASRRERPSDSAPAGSGAMAAPAERGVTRGDAPETRGTREARNLPQADADVARPAGSADRVTLQVSDGDGRATRIRVSVVGDQVRAVITPPDAESARQLEQRMDELQSALARQGFTASTVSVQTAEPRGGGDALAGAGLAVSSGEARTTPGRDQPAGDQRQGRGQRDQQSAGGQERQQQQGRSRDQGAQQRRR